MSISNTASALPAFVSRHLDEIARSEGLSNYTVESKGIGAGEGFMSNMLAITLVSTEQRLSLICKLPLPEPESPDVLDTQFAFDREVEMYQTVLPLMEELQRKNGLTAETGFYAYPKCFVSECAANNESIIILEDLRLRDYSLHDKLKPLKFENVALLLQQLGRYNALSFVLRDQQPEVFAKLDALEDYFMKWGIINPGIQGIFSSAIEQAIVLVDEEKDKALLRAFLANYVDLGQTRRCPKRLKRFGVLIHGDCHINNMMFKSENGTPASIVLIDWQGPVVASPVSDLVNFIFWCTEKSLRDQHFDDLLHIYHDELTRVINACGSDASALFSFDDLLDQMHEFTINAVATSPAAVSYMITDSKDLKSLAELAECDGDDVNSKMLAPLTKETEQRYKLRLLDIINDARRLGYLNKFEGQ